MDVTTPSPLLKEQLDPVKISSASDWAIHTATLMRTAIKMVLPWMLLVFVVGCTQNSDINSLERRLNDAETQLAKTREELTALQATVAPIKKKFNLDNLTKDWDKVAYLTPGAEGYSVVAFDLGILTVQLTDIKPYANGSKVTLRFGNTLSSSINGLKATVEWGKVNANGITDDDSTRTREMTFIQTIRAGAWTPVTVVLDGIPPTELAFVQVSKLSHTGIQLLR